jgi:hypothetical protein
MKHMRTEQIPATTREVVDKVTCDLCGTEINCRGGDAEEVEVKHRTGFSYPEGGAGEEVSVDLCGKCFDEKLVPWLRSQGVEPRTEDWDW